MSREILIVDDEVGIRELLSEILMDEGYDVALADSAEQARTYRLQRCPDLVLLDIWMPDMDGIGLLKEWKGSGQLTMPVVMMSGHGTIDTAVEAVQIGAVGFLEKPVALKKLLEMVSNGLRHTLPKSVPVEPVAKIGATRDPQSASVLMCDGESFPDLSSAHMTVPLNLPLREARDLFERRYFEWLMVQTDGNITRAAEQAGVERTHLYRKLKQLGVAVAKKTVQEI